jgi:hypothetical protein
VQPSLLKRGWLGSIDELKMFGSGLIEATGNYIIAALDDDGIQCLEGDTRLVVLIGLRQ